MAAYGRQNGDITYSPFKFRNVVAVSNPVESNPDESNSSTDKNTVKNNIEMRDMSITSCRNISDLSDLEQLVGVNNLESMNPIINYMADSGSNRTQPNNYVGSGLAGVIWQSAEPIHSYHDSYHNNHTPHNGMSNLPVTSDNDKSIEQITHTLENTTTNSYMHKTFGINKIINASISSSVSISSGNRVQSPQRSSKHSPYVYTPSIGFTNSKYGSRSYITSEIGSIGLYSSNPKNRRRYK